MKGNRTKTALFLPGISKASGILVVIMAMLFMAMPVNAGITTQNMTTGLTPHDLAAKIVGEGVTIDNVTLVCTNGASGTFDGGLEILGISSGIALSSGSISSIPGPNIYDSISTMNYYGSDTDLNSLIPGYSTLDTCKLEFDFVPTGNTLYVKYVFMSDEYNYYVNSIYNDVFGFFLNGMNIALIPGTNVAVSINNVNGGNPYGDMASASHPEFYRNNDLDDGGSAIDTEMNGLTTVFVASADVVPNEVNHIKLAIADAGDMILDSNVAIGAGSFTSFNKGSASGTKFSDQNQNGTRDSNEPVLPNWPITITNTETGVTTQALTNETGAYIFPDLIIGTYVVEEIQQNGYVQTAPVQGNYTITVTKAGENYVGLDFGNYKIVPKLGSISGVKYNDANKNGVKDDTEEKLPGWQINLANETDIINTVTNETGYYEFTELPPGTYTVKETIKSGWFQTEPALLSSYKVTITESEKYNLNFGNVFDTPSANCIAGINPGGRIPPAKGGQRPNGFYQLVGTSLFPNLQVYLKDLASGTVFGPYSVGQYIKYTQNNARVGETVMPGDLMHINGNGDFVTYSVNSAGTVSEETLCTVPKPPK